MNCSAVPCTTPSPRPSDHRPRGRPEINRGRAGQTGGSAMPAHHRTHTKNQQRASLEINGGSRLREGAAVAAYTLPDMPYDYGALDPHISGEIMELHHSPNLLIR